MKSITSLMASAAVAFSLAGCEQAQSSDELNSHSSQYWDTPTQDQSHNAAPSHDQQLVGNGQNGITDLVAHAAELAQQGTPDQVARMHGTQKIQYKMLGAFLTDLGVSLKATAAAKGATPAATAGNLYTAGASALGAPIYPSRTPEMILPSTSALAKEFDIFMAAAPQIIAGIANSTRCPGVALVTAGDLTQDGISCLLGKPASPDHVSLAQQIVASASDPTTGQAIAVATLLAAAQISE